MIKRYYFYAYKCLDGETNSGIVAHTSWFNEVRYMHNWVKDYIPKDAFLMVFNRVN